MYKRHHKSAVNFIICIVCENIYHISEFNSLKNTEYLSNSFVICDECNHLTSKVDKNTLDVNKTSNSWNKRQWETKVKHEMRQEINQFQYYIIQIFITTLLLMRTVFNETPLHKQLVEEVKFWQKILMS